MNIPNSNIGTEPTSEEVNELVKAYIGYLSENPYGAVTAVINDAPCTVIAAVEDENMEKVQPMFIIPSPELIAMVIDAVDKKPIFAIAPQCLN